MIKRLQRLFTGRQGNTVGIDIGTESVKLAEVMNKGEHPVLVSTGILPMPTGLIDDGHIVDGEALSGLLRQLLSTSGVSSRDVVLAIGGRTIFAREVLLPVMSEEELREAENLKQRQKGLLHRVGWPDEPSALHRQLDLVVGELVREVRRTVEYYQIQNRDAVIDKIFLTGGASKLDNLAQHIAAQLNMPVLLHQPLRTLSSVPALDQDYLNRLFPQLATAIGLALRGGSR